MLDQLLGSRLRAKVLGWLFTHPDERFFVRQLTSLLREDSANVSRELARLETFGIVASRVEGRQKYYQADRRSPIFPDLRGLAVKTTGLGDTLRGALAPFRDRVRAAFLFGSFAEGRETAGSDVDLFVVGDVGAREAASRLGPAGRRLGREVNAVIYTPAELRKKAREGHHFVSGVIRGAKLFLMGTEDDLEGIVG
jgi:predicted nucleotidyltransferase